MANAEMALPPDAFAESDEVGIHQLELGLKMERRDVVHFKIHHASALLAPRLVMQVPSARHRPVRTTFRAAVGQGLRELDEWVFHGVFAGTTKPVTVSLMP